MTDNRHRLDELGHALERAIRAQLAAAPAASRPRWRSRRRLALGAVALALAIPAAAIAATQLLTTQQVAQTLPAGTKALIGTDPTCTVVTAGVEYHCTLANEPAPAFSANGPAVAPSPGAIVSYEVAIAHNNHTLLLRASCEHGELIELRAAGAKRLQSRRLIIRLRKACGIRFAPAAAGTTGTTGATSATTDWAGALEATVDATKHVNGGCRALNATGTSWDCYIGQAAVTQNIIGQGFLGQYAPSPGVG